MSRPTAVEGQNARRLEELGWITGNRRVLSFSVWTDGGVDPGFAQPTLADWG